jgi:uncharacterized protein (TIGR02996 family)
MHTKAEWLRTICEVPEDIHTRLVYADWLEENGEGERAELIRLQLGFNQGPSCEGTGEVGTMWSDRLLPSLPTVQRHATQGR